MLKMYYNYYRQNSTKSKQGETAMPEIKNLAENIARIRKEMKETQADFAAHCDIGAGTLNLMENQRTDPRLSSIQKVAAYTGLTVPELLSREDTYEGLHTKK